MTAPTEAEVQQALATLRAAGWDLSEDTGHGRVVGDVLALDWTGGGARHVRRVLTDGWRRADA